MSTDPPKVLMHLSLARTALDDPDGLPEGELDDHVEGIEVEHGVYGSTQGPPWSATERYAVDQIDNAMHSLDTEDHKVLALRTICELITDIGGPEPPDDDDPQNLIAVMQGAVASLSWVADVLEKRGYE